MLVINIPLLPLILSFSQSYGPGIYINSPKKDIGTNLLNMSPHANLSIDVFSLPSRLQVGKRGRGIPLGYYKESK